MYSEAFADIKLKALVLRLELINPSLLKTVERILSRSETKAEADCNSDEPTTNLDEERRRTFVKIISEVFNKGTGPLNQLIIITHDEEIFEDSEIEQVYKFQMTERGSLVKAI